MHYSDVTNIFIVKILLNSIFTNDLKRKDFFSKNFHSCRLSHFKALSMTTAFCDLILDFLEMYGLTLFKEIICYHEAI